ncbi:YafY family protein [Kitasatospora sp. NPDC002227]|uniref:helix-turn-helix transcriptional regulator n=1 Tax=Kitasatospora sp. NPDC002227 TaxID=3154773 RepID=UPI0033219339
MRASRLISLLLLLQNRGRLTAAQLAEELEVSVRTVYRDVEALSAAGIPLYGEAGHAGGYQLLDGFRTRLTGLTPAEAQAALLAALPGPAAQLGLGEARATAQLKLRAALPAPAGWVEDRFHLDAPGWYGRTDETPHLTAVAAAVRERHALQVDYSSWDRTVQRRLEPYGLVLKAGRWYLVASPGGGAARTYRVDQILELATLPDRFTPPADFHLATHWQAQVADFHARRHTAEATVRLSPHGLTRIHEHLGSAEHHSVRRTATLDPDGWTTARLPIESLAHAHDQFLRLGTDLEVLAPPELREMVAETVRTLNTRYHPG